MGSGTVGPPSLVNPTTTQTPPPADCIDQWIGDGCTPFANENWNMYCSECACVLGDASTCEIGVPHYVGDDFCDDENNNVMCGFDGGDCCAPHEKPIRWDWYCNDCQCLNDQPTA